MNACGVAVARMLGHNWVPIPSKGSEVNVGTISVPPEDRRSQRRGVRLIESPAPDEADTAARVRAAVVRALGYEPDGLDRLIARALR